MRSLDAFREAVPRRSVVVDGVRWEYVAEGSGPAVMFLHGMAGSADVWFQQLDLLAPRSRVIAPTYPDEVRTLAGLAAGVLAIAEHEAVDRLTLVGSSLGGYLAQYLIRERPDLVASAVFGNTFPPNDLIARAARFQAPLARVVPEALLTRRLRADAARRLVPADRGSPLLARLLDEVYTAAGAKRRFLGRLACVLEPFTAPRPDVPVRIVESERDPLVWPDLRRLLRETYPMASVHTFSDLGHFPYVSKPEAYVAAIEPVLP